jgi:signal transduction histidine kinase
VDGFSERTGKLVHYESSFDGRLDGATETQLFRIAQEALTNVVRHSEATEVWIELSADHSQVRLSISDNGKGIGQDYVHRGTGMVGMRARARSAGGRLTVDSRPGKGVSITVEIPLKHANYAAQDQNSISR